MLYPGDFYLSQMGLFSHCKDSSYFSITQSQKWVNCNVFSSLHVGIGGLRNYLYICTTNVTQGDKRKITH